MKYENIAAISTSLAPAGVAVIRISGESPLLIAEKMFKPVSKILVSQFEPNKMYPGEIKTDSFNDFGLCVYFKAPKSFTGEDIVEFHCHGGVAITKGILNKILSLGARIATKGEFTKRAFINGKLSLSSAEGLIDMINSESESGVRAGYALYREKLNTIIDDLQSKLLDSISEIDADMDFPEEDLENVSREKVKNDLIYVNDKIEALLKTYKTGRVLKEGVKVAIVGKPNTGKSSLLNALLCFDKAIVSNIAGTTRDIVEGSIKINGINFNFYDTAGIHESENAIENLGVDKAKKLLNSADLILFVIGNNFDDDDKSILNLIKNYNILILQNKCDTKNAEFANADLKISAITNENIEELKNKIYDKVIFTTDLNSDYLCEERHYDALKQALINVKSALKNIDCVPLDILAIDIKLSWDKLGEITGKTATEDIINNIFSKFCVGK